MLQYAFRAVQFALCCGIAALIWNSVYPLARGVAFAGFEPVPSSAEPAPAAQFADYQVIDGRNLFKPLDGAPGPDVAEAPVEPSRLQVELLGTIAKLSGKDSRGVLKDLAKNEVKVVKIGDQIGADSSSKVVRIEQRRIVLEHDGRLEEIVVDAKRDQRERTRRSSKPRPDGAGKDKFQARVERRMMEQLRRMNQGQSLETPAGGVPVDVAQSGDGTANGIQIQQVGADSKLAAFGLQAGDRIVAVNGIRITDSVPLDQLMLTLGMDSTKVFEIDRSGLMVQVEVPAENVLEVIQELGGA